MTALLVSTKIVAKRGISRQCLRDLWIVALEDNGADVTFGLLVGVASNIKINCSLHVSSEWEGAYAQDSDIYMTL